MSIGELNELPESWRWAKLGEIALLNPTRPRGLVRSDDRETTFVPMPAVDERSGSILRPEVKPFSAVRKGYTFFAEGDVLFAKITPCMQNGKHAIARDLIDGIGFGSTEFHVFRPCEDVTSQWLHLFLRQPSVLQAATEHFTGAVGQQRVPVSFLADLDIPLAPLPEQNRITAILTEQIAVVEKARIAAEERLKAAKELPAAYLREAFVNEEANGWPVRKIGEFVKVQSGYAFKSEWFTHSGVRLLRNANVFQGYLDWNNVVNLPDERRHEFMQFELAEGDIVLSLDRPLVANGLKIARLMKNDLPCLLLQRVGRFCINGEIDSDYLYAFLNSQIFIDEISGHDQSLGVPHVSPKQIEAIQIPIPPIEKQTEIARMLEQKKVISKKLSQIAEDELAAINKLTPSLLRQAFSGEL